MTALLFGISFRNPDTGEQAQLGIETRTNRILVRSTTGGAWSDWECPWENSGGDDGGDNGSSGGAHDVIMANMALRWSAPLKLELTGDAAGNVSFDGSEGVVSCAVTMTKQTADGVTEAEAEEIARRIAGELMREHEYNYAHNDAHIGN